ncbi:BTB/POZ domain-containing protein 1-like [Cylas formicarius]|uniref:BTB/POZ domain-containing protein 1-like n=1 Tax=Cylas formicarius TaxID=197179 RepID=UPI002958499A|nr:BTB/POZ domain-containing protein 1-like [Cylas formicarius]
MSAAPAPCDWQTTRKLVKDRGQYLLESGIWSDCRFIVGAEPNQQVLQGHKLFLAMASPVFEAMFFGGMAEKDPIAILDVQPDAFRALLEYIYTDKINLTSFDQACELCYGAKKYMLPHLVDACTRYLWSDLYPKNACRAYEFARLFDAPDLMAKCITIICEQTQDVLSESSFEEVELNTILTVFDQDVLNISSELELFSAIARYAARIKYPRVDDSIGHASVETNNPTRPTLQDAIKKIRFLTLTPQQFAEGPGKSTLLSESEKFAILMNICSPSAAVPYPEGFSKQTEPRKKKPSESSNWEMPPMDTSRTSMIKFNTSNIESNNETPKKMICNRLLLGTTECMNTSVLDCALTFTCDKNVCVYGIQVPAQVPLEEDHQPQYIYPELLYAHLLDAEGSRLTYTHFTSRVNYRSLIEISFNRPVYIQRNKVYKVGVVLNKIGFYPIGTYSSQTMCNGVTFTFSPGQGFDSIRDGLIRSIIFSMPSNNGNMNNPGMSGIM